MGMNIWWGDGPNDAMSLGDPAHVWRAFAEIADILGDDEVFDELQSVPGFGEQTVTPWWLWQVHLQAELCLLEHEDELSEFAQSLLRSLSKQAGEAAPGGMARAGGR